VPPGLGTTRPIHLVAPVRAVVASDHRPAASIGPLMVVGGAGLRPLALAPVLETSNVVRFALLFGTTWFVNALVFAGILVSVSLAIEVARRVRFRRPALLYAPVVRRGRSRVGDSARVTARPGLRPEVRRRRGPRVHAGLHREPRVRGPIPRRGILGDRVRHEPPRRDRRGRPGIRRARDRLPRAPDRRGGAVRALAFFRGRSHLVARDVRPLVVGGAEP
jgi:hypothetical protein